MSPADFVPLREIGRGAHGVVHLARNSATGAFAALKVCDRPEGDAATPAALAAWERERRGTALYAALPPHPGLVRILAFDESPDGRSFRVAMELADPEDAPASSTGRSFGIQHSAFGIQHSAFGIEAYRPRTLASVLQAEIALPLRDCLSLGLRLAGALEFLQSRHLAHRDVKPSNVLFVRGRPVLADVGLVADLRDAKSLVGTPGYEPPEHHGTPQGDVYSLGRTLARASLGREPEEGGFVPCPEADSDAPGFWRWMQILARACALAPERRYRSAKALRKALAALALRVGLRTRVWPVLRLALLAAALVALGFLLARAFAPAPAAAPGELLLPGKGSPFEQPVYRVVGENGSFTFVPAYTQESIEETQRAAEQAFRDISEKLESSLEDIRADVEEARAAAQSDAETSALDPFPDDPPGDGAFPAPPDERLPPFSTGSQDSQD